MYLEACRVRIIKCIVHTGMFWLLMQKSTSAYRNTIIAHRFVYGRKVCPNVSFVCRETRKHHKSPSQRPLGWLQMFISINNICPYARERACDADDFIDCLKRSLTHRTQSCASVLCSRATGAVRLRVDTILSPSHARYTHAHTHTHANQHTCVHECPQLSVSRMFVLRLVSDLTNLLCRLRMCVHNQIQGNVC